MKPNLDLRADPVRKRPKQRRSDATVGMIIEATARIVRREGAHRLSTNRIAEVAGFSIGTLYQYFRNKDGVLVAMIERESREVLDRMRRVLASADTRPLEETLREAVRTMIGAYRTPNRALRQVVLEMAVHRGQMPRIYGYVRDAESALAEMLSKIKHPEARALSPIARFVTVRSLVGCLRATVLENVAVVDEPEFEDEMVRMLRAALTDAARSAPVSAR